MCLTGGSINSLHPQGPLILIISSKGHIIALLHTIKEVLPAKALCIWGKRFQLIFKSSKIGTKSI